MWIRICPHGPIPHQLPSLLSFLFGLSLCTCFLLSLALGFLPQVLYLFQRCCKHGQPIRIEAKPVAQQYPSTMRPLVPFSFLFELHQVLHCVLQSSNLLTLKIAFGLKPSLNFLPGFCNLPMRCGVRIDAAHSFNQRFTLPECGSGRWGFRLERRVFIVARIGCCEGFEQRGNCSAWRYCCSVLDRLGQRPGRTATPWRAEAIVGRLVEDSACDGRKRSACEKELDSADTNSQLARQDPARKRPQKKQKE
jgi:hypothetical protein